jgi:hypothetical protein
MDVALSAAVGSHLSRRCSAIIPENMNVSDTASFLHNTIFFDRWLLTEIYNSLQIDENFDDFVFMVQEMAPVDLLEALAPLLSDIRGDTAMSTPPKSLLLRASSRTLTRHHIRQLWSLVPEHSAKWPSFQSFCKDLATVPAETNSSFLKQLAYDSTASLPTPLVTQLHIVLATRDADHLSNQMLRDYNAEINIQNTSGRSYNDLPTVTAVLERFRRIHPLFLHLEWDSSREVLQHYIDDIYRFGRQLGLDDALAKEEANHATADYYAVRHFIEHRYPYPSSQPDPSAIRFSCPPVQLELPSLLGYKRPAPPDPVTPTEKSSSAGIRVPSKPGTISANSTPEPSLKRQKMARYETPKSTSSSSSARPSSSSSSGRGEESSSTDNFPSAESESASDKESDDDSATSTDSKSDAPNGGHSDSEDQVASKATSSTSSSKSSRKSSIASEDRPVQSLENAKDTRQGDDDEESHTEAIGAVASPVSIKDEAMEPMAQFSSEILADDENLADDEMAEDDDVLANQHPALVPRPIGHDAKGHNKDESGPLLHISIPPSARPPTTSVPLKSRTKKMVKKLALSSTLPYSDHSTESESTSLLRRPLFNKRKSGTPPDWSSKEWAEKVKQVKQQEEVCRLRAIKIEEMKKNAPPPPPLPKSPSTDSTDSDEFFTYAVPESLRVKSQAT